MQINGEIYTFLSKKCELRAVETFVFFPDAHKHTFPHRSGAELRAFISNYHCYRPVRPEEIRGGLAWLLHREIEMVPRLFYTFFPPFSLHFPSCSFLLLFSSFYSSHLCPFLSGFPTLITVAGSFLWFDPDPTPPLSFFFFFTWFSLFILRPCEAAVLSLRGRCISFYCPHGHKHMH